MKTTQRVLQEQGREHNSTARFALELDSESIRRAEYKGVEHIVAPAVIAVEGLLWACNAESPEYVPSSALQGGIDSWDGRPVVLNHPRIGGELVSANSPQVLEGEQFGILFNTQFDVTKSSLVTEVWLNPVRASELSETHSKALKNIEEGVVRELSMGVFARVVQQQGVYEGQTYDAYWQSIWPDHLAVLDEGSIGACSIKDGCGIPRLASQTEQTDQIKQIKAVRATIAGTSDCTCDKCSEGKECDCSQRVLNERRIMQDPRVGRVSAGDFRIALNNVLSAFDLSTALELLLEQKENVKQPYVIDIFDTFFVFAGLVERSYGYYRSGYDVSEAGAVTLEGELVRVRPRTQYTEVAIDGNNSDNQSTRLAEVVLSQQSQSTRGTTMNKEQKIEALIASKQTRYNDNHREKLKALDDNVLDMMIEGLLNPAPQEPAPVGGSPIDPMGDGTTSRVSQGQGQGQEQELSLEKYLEGTPLQVREILQRALVAEQSQKDIMIERIKVLGVWSEEELKVMEVNMLSNIFKAATRGSARTDDSPEGSAEVSPLLNSYIGMPTGGVETSLSQGTPKYASLPQSIFQ